MVLHQRLKPDDCLALIPDEYVVLLENGRLDLEVFAKRKPGSACVALMDAGLIAAINLDNSTHESVGGALPDFPTGKTVLHQSENRLEAAQSAAITEWRGRALDELEDDPGHRRVLVRARRDWTASYDPTFPTRFILDNGAALFVYGHYEDDHPLEKYWMALEFQVLEDDNSEPSMYYNMEWAVPDTGHLTIPTYGPGLCQSLGRSVVVTHLIDSLDLSGLGLIDPAGTFEFLRQAHTGEISRPSHVFESDGRDFLSRLTDARAGHSQGAHSAFPSPRLVKTAAAAEAYAAEVTQCLGFLDATPTGPGSDGGIDVRSSSALAQVKMEAVATGRPVVQALFGICAVEGKRAFFFSLAGYTAQALAWADQAGVACFEFAFDGSVVAANSTAAGLPPTTLAGQSSDPSPPPWVQRLTSRCERPSPRSLH